MRRRPSAAARRVAGLLVGVLLVPLLATGTPAAAAARPTVEQLRQQRRAVQQQRAAQAAQINVLKASDRQLTKALDTLQRNRTAQLSDVAAARQRAAVESARAAQATAAEAATTKELDALRASVRHVAVAEFIRGGSADELLPGDLSQPMESARRRTLLDAAVGRSSDVTDELRTAQADLQREQHDAETASAAAATEQQRLERGLAQLDAATTQQRALAAQIEAKLERSLAESDSLASVDGRLASQIAADQAALVRRLREAPSDGGSSAGPSQRVGSVSLRTVRGITVASSIATQLGDLLDAADASGVQLGGNGYRDSEQQVQARRAHCGSSDYDIYDKPASQCNPPTARPGTSMHERGLAIDFTSGGGVISRGSAAYRWLQGNAGRFGLYNLPGEPWHWSVNGD